MKSNIVLPASQLAVLITTITTAYILIMSINNLSPMSNVDDITHTLLITVALVFWVITLVVISD
jgi:hypothetical protein